MLRLKAPHVEERHQELSGFVIAEPFDALIDNALDRDSGVVKLTPQAIIFGKAQSALIHHHIGKALRNLLQAPGNPGDPQAVVVVQSALNKSQPFERDRICRFECSDRVVTPVGGEIASGDAHLADRLLETVTGVGSRVRVPIALEGIRDLPFSRDERDAVGDEADHGNKRDQENARSYRQGADQPRWMEDPKAARLTGAGSGRD